MRKLLTAFFVSVFLLPVSGQDFSNKGKEFWLCFPSHTPSGISIAKLALFITSDKNSSGTVSVNGFNTTFSVVANRVSGPIDIPYNVAHINPAESGTPVKKGIYVKVDPGQSAVVVYAHLYAGVRSAATLVLPVVTLGKVYYSANFWQSSVSGSQSQFQVIATEPNTVVKIQKRSNGILSPFSTTHNLNTPGEVLQVQDQGDLTGSIIESIASGREGCKRIAVFSGSSALSINRPGCAGDSYDPLFQQLYPVTTWGKEYGVVPFSDNANGYHVRVIASEDNTNVIVAGLTIGLNKGEFFPAPSAAPGPFTAPMVVRSDKPVCVMQYMMSAACANGAGPQQGDPDMVILSPVEQNIRDISIFSSSFEAVAAKYMSVYMKTNASASFKINGRLPSASFIPMVPNNGYSYLVENISGFGITGYRLTADSGFNAIAYGLGRFESYAYSAGTNLKDIYQYVTIDNDYATVNFPSGCKNSPFRFSMTFPYQPFKIKWQFGAALNVFGLSDTTINNLTADSTFVVNGKTLYRYRLKRTYNISASGTYPITVVADNPTNDGCSGEQEIDYDLQIFDPPAASFTSINTGCITNPVLFADQTKTTDSILNPVVKWYWNFGDNTPDGTKKSESHFYGTGGSYPVKLAVITAVGCLSDTARQNIVIAAPPEAQFSLARTACEKKQVTLKDASTVLPGSTLAKWYWNLGDGTIITKTDATDVTHTYATAGTYNVQLEVETNTGCKSLAFKLPVVVNAEPKADFNLPGNVCLPIGLAQFTNTSTISDGSAAQLTYLWNFGDGRTDTEKDPTHNYTAAGPYTVKLTAASKDGCIGLVDKVFNTIYVQPVADFTVNNEVCLGAATTFTDKSDGKGSRVTQWQWDFDDGQTAAGTATVTHTYAIAKTYNPKLIVTTDKGCSSVVVTKPTIATALPAADFTINSTACVGKAIQFNDASKSGNGIITKWNWNFDDGNTASIGNPKNTFAIPKTYNVSLIVETSAGCKSAIAKTTPVKVNVLPQPNFGTPKICLSDPAAQFTDSSKITDGSESQFTYLWNFDMDGNPGATSTVKNPVYNYTQARDYLVRLTVTSKDGCSKDTTKNFTVNGAIPKADFIVANATQLCSNTSITINDASSVDFGKLVKVEIYWDYQNNPTAKTVDDNPVAGKIYSYKYPDFGLPRTKNFEIRYFAYSGINCISQISRTITVNASPQVQLTTIPAVCEEVPAFTLVQGSETTGFTGSAAYSGPGVSANGMFTPLVAKPGLHTIVYTFLGDNGCKASKSGTVRVYPTPLLDAGPDRYLLEGGYLVFQPKVTGNRLQYLWTPTNFLDNPRTATPKVTATADTRYELTVTSVNGCVVKDDVVVKVLKSLVVPNTFTPNGDGINDTWAIEYLESYPGATVQIYNRYGQLVYSSNGYPKPWDGTINGNPLPVATYYWIINPKNGRLVVNGSVTIIR
jgi:gliding motility-associated-like protein